eukprot:TRINITY_DN30073_c0_g1_i1.p1 TRINITY_DN30073_c0_g1~~TRINITY_DN30073_c0_g1_i1.p1  ORF type:complete len:142 (+),score=38.55 TRINITY_DN30073_c0_g1_i1:48-428(+)
MAAVQASAAFQAASLAGEDTSGKGKGKGKGKSKKGKGKGKGPREDAPAVNVEPPPADKEFHGYLKSRSEKNGYGFIVCEDIKEGYGRDVWVDGGELPEEVAVESKLNFNVVLSSKGHPQAKNVRLA